MTNRDRPTLLLVEDDAATRGFLGDNLDADGYEVVTAETAAEALRLLGTAYPDVAIVDAGLPDASGLDLVAHVRAADGVASRIDPGVPMLVLIPRDGELERVRALERGADDVLAKPCTLVTTSLACAHAQGHHLRRQVNAGPQGFHRYAA